MNKTALLSTLPRTGHCPTTDYLETGKLYPPIQAFLKGELLATTRQFDSCDSVKSWLLATYEINAKDLTCYYKRED